MNNATVAPPTTRVRAPDATQPLPRYGIVAIGSRPKSRVPPGSQHHRACRRQIGCATPTGGRTSQVAILSCRPHLVKAAKCPVPEVRRYLPHVHLKFATHATYFRETTLEDR